MGHTTEKIQLGRALALTGGGPTLFTRDLDLLKGKLVRKLVLAVNHAVTIGTGAGPRAEGGLRIVRGVTLQTDKGENLVNNVPGRALYRFDHIKSGAAAFLDAIAASTSTFRVVIPIWLADRLAARPWDTIVDMRRYETLTLQVNYGVIGDLFSTVGTATVTGTLDLYAEVDQGPMPEHKSPLFHPEYGIVTPADPASVTTINLERAANLIYKRLMLAATENATAGLAFSGDADADAVLEWTVEHSKGFPFRSILQRIIEAENKQDYALEAELDSYAIFDFMRDGSHQSALYSGRHALLQARWTNDVAGAGTRQVSCAYEAMRPLV